MFTDHPDYNDHEFVAFCRDPNAGLAAIIALHDTSAGPAMGGCRMVPYKDEAHALTDVLRLSKGMSYKNIMAGLPYGGGKAVIIADPCSAKTPTLLGAFAAQVHRLGGTFITGEDVGTTVSDIEEMRRGTPYVRGIPEGGPGDPSPMTAEGVSIGIRVAATLRLGTSDLKGVRVAVQGLGAVGMRLARLLHEAGATLIVSDIDSRRTEQAVAELGAVFTSPDMCHAVAADVYAPCALGGILNERTIGSLQALVVAGAANNQLGTAADGLRLAERGILYAPDYVINAGGVISAAHEGVSFDRARMLNQVHAIGATLRDIFTLACAEGEATSAVADRLAKERLAQAQERRRSLPDPKADLLKQSDR